LISFDIRAAANAFFCGRNFCSPHFFLNEINSNCKIIATDHTFVKEFKNTFKQAISA